MRESAGSPSRGALWSSGFPYGLLGALRGRGRVGSSRAPDAFTRLLRLLRTYFTHLQGGFAAAAASAPCVPGVPPGCPRPRSHRATLDAAAPDGFMGVPPVPEASGQRWGPVLFALFLAASRGKVDPAWALGQSTRRTQRAGWGESSAGRGTLGAPFSREAAGTAWQGAATSLPSALAGW